ncbi:hypothetical protein COOONC_04720, partial [Cooperia oncophora]
PSLLSRKVWTHLCKVQIVLIKGVGFSVAEDIIDLSRSRAGESDAVPVEKVLRKESAGRSPFHVLPMSYRTGIRDVVYESAKQRVIVAEYRNAITQQQIIAFTHEIDRMATKDESGNGHVLISDLYSVLSRSPPEVRKCFGSRVINKLVLSSDTSNGCVSCHLLAEYLTACCRRSQQFLFVQNAARSTEYITTNEFLDLVMAEISNKLSWESGMKDCPFYYAVFIERCVFFQLDPQRTGKISILELASTGLLDDLFEVLSQQERDPADNSCSASVQSVDFGDSWSSSVLVIEMVLEWCLSKNVVHIEMEQLRLCSWRGCLPIKFCMVTSHHTRMDFRGFVDLDAAITSKNQPASIRWLFRMLDLRDDGVLDRGEIKMMVQSMLENLSAMENWAVNFKADDIVDEIIDMINPAEPNRIVVDDVLACNMAETALGILVDYDAFLKYENREEEAANS